MRIVGGQWRGKGLADLAQGDAAAHLRPTSDRVRESLFNLLQNGRLGDVVRGARVLDLFAGTGALGLEALSRGAARALFVDSGRVAQGLLRDNIGRCGAKALSKVVRVDATDLGPCPEEASDLVFLDPPYGQGLGEAALSAAQVGGWIAPGALIVWEENAAPLPPPGLSLLDERRYGGTVLSLWRAP